MSRNIPRWNPALPVLPPETPDRARIQGALWRHWRADLDRQLIAAAVVRQPFPLISSRTGKAFETPTVEPLAFETTAEAQAPKRLLIVDEASTKTELVQSAHDKAQMIAMGSPA